MAMVERFAEPDFWMWTGIIFGVNAIAMALLGVTVLAVLAAVTGFSALLTAAVIGRNAVWEQRRDGRSPV
jgi:energy-converting hydrogenase Eha subunit A